MDGEEAEATCSTTTTDFHTECLEKICRICAAKLITHGYSYPVNKHIVDIQNVFGVDAGKDIISVHPEKFCNACYSSISNFKKRGKRPSTEIFQWIDRCGGKRCSIYVKSFR